MQNKFRLLTILLLFSLSSYNILAQRTIQFSGIRWYVRNDPGGPGPNQWSDSENSIYVDTLGYLHLKITKIGSTWYCSEVYTEKSYGYGNYIFQLASNPEKYDPNIVVGLFTYENDSREIDIELSRWGDPLSVDGWYTIQPPPYNSKNQKSFSLNLTNKYSAHIIDWSKDSINLQSYRGNFNEEPSTDSLIQEWTYKGSKNPPPGSERLHINFWLLEGHAPVNQKEAELVIKSVSVIVREGSLNVIITPEGAVNAGAKWSLDNGPWQESNTLNHKLTAGKHRVDFKHIDGWISPQGKNINIIGDSIIYDTSKYTLATDVKERLNYNIPQQNELEQNYPNPFNPLTNLSFVIGYKLSRSFVSLKVFNPLGKEVATLINKKLPAGNYKYQWDATGYVSGVYFYQLAVADFIQTKKMLLLK